MVCTVRSKTVEGCDSQSGHSIIINTPIWHRNEELYDPIIWKACYGTQCPSAEWEQKASLMPVFICCLSAFQHPQIHGQPHFCRLWNPRAIPCGASVRAFLYNQIKMRLSFKCFGLTFSPLSFIFVSECAFLLKTTTTTTKKTQQRNFYHLLSRVLMPYGPPVVCRPQGE